MYNVQCILILLDNKANIYIFCYSLKFLCSFIVLWVVKDLWQGSDDFTLDINRSSFNYLKEIATQLLQGTGMVAKSSSSNMRESGMVL